MSSIIRLMCLLAVATVVAAVLVGAPSTPSEAAGPRLWRAVDAGGQHSCAIRKSSDPRLDRGLYCWGTTEAGVLGQGEEYSASYRGPTRVGTGQWRSVSASDLHTCGIGMSQTLYCWGYNRTGAVGDGTSGGYLTRRSPKALSGSWRSVTTGALHTCGIGRSGALYCWGENANGQLGDGTTKSRSRPVRVGTRSDWGTVVARDGHTCATKTDGRLYCWGGNYLGASGLGYRLDGTDVDHTTTPHLVTEGVSSIALGLGWTCYVAGSDLSCMGDNQSGVFGNGTKDPLYDPTQINSEVSWRQVSTMDAHTCGIATDRTLRCWGDNVVGQVGDGTRRDRLSPVRVGTRADWSSVSVGARHTCGLKVDGRVYCWGSNAQWQTGTSARGPFVEPRLVS